MAWYCYILECADGSLYTGSTKDIHRRIKEHNLDNKLGSKYIRSKRLVKLVYLEKIKTKSQVHKRENSIKKWNRERKLKLIEFGHI